MTHRSVPRLRSALSAIVILFGLACASAPLAFPEPAKEGFYAAYRQSTASLAELPLLPQSAITYVGAFRVPQQDGNGNDLTWGGYALAIDPVSNGLFIGCHDWHQRLAEISIPAVIALTQTATILQNCADATEGRLDLVDDYLPKLGGSLVYNGRLIVSAYGYYDADFSQVLSHFVSSPDLSQTGDVAGPYQMGDWAGIVAGYMATIPNEWRSAFGGPALTGQCCIPIISRTSAGPAASVFNPDHVGDAHPVPATPVLYYPLEHPLAPETTQNDYFNLTTQIVGVAFPPGTRSVLFFGKHGSGPYCYGTAEECGDPVDPYKGPHAYPYVHQVGVYDALELLAVKDGQRQPWEVQPYAIWRLSEMDAAGSASIAGAAYDPTGGRVYITEQYGDEPVVLVYRISLPATPTSTPTITPASTATAAPRPTLTSTVAPTRTPAECAPRAHDNGMSDIPHIRARASAPGCRVYVPLMAAQ